MTHKKSKNRMSFDCYYTETKMHFKLKEIVQYCLFS